MKLSEKNYDLAKWVVQILLPAFGALYAGLSDLLNLPYALEVVGTTSLIAVFLGTILGISNANYKKYNEPNGGVISVTGANPDTGLPDVQLTMTKNPADLVNKDTVTLKVESPPNS